MTKGWLVTVDGRLEYREWDADGSTRRDYSVVGRVEFLTALRATVANGAGEREPEKAAA